MSKTTQFEYIPKAKELKFIDRIGVEIEGAWFKPQSGLYDDRSVTGYINHFHTWYRKSTKREIPGYNGDNYLDYIGEKISKPLSYSDTIKFIDDFWPDDTMERCGFHIHVSFKNISSYTKLMEKEFFEFFLKHMEQWGLKNKIESAQFWSRLRGENNFCTKKFIPEKQAALKEKKQNDPTRYCIFNYCFGIHKTIECRLLPTFETVTEAKSAFDAVIESFEIFLEKHTKTRPELDEIHEVEDDGEIIRKEEEFLITDNEEVKKKFALKPYNLFAVTSKAFKASRKPKKQPSFFEIIAGQVPVLENDDYS